MERALPAAPAQRVRLSVAQAKAARTLAALAHGETVLYCRAGEQRAAGGGEK